MDEEEREFYLAINLKEVDRQFWIDRKGKVYKYKGDLAEDIVSFHNEIAQQLYPDEKYPGDILYDMGWIIAGSKIYPSTRIKGKPTQAQINKLHSLGIYRFLCFEYGGNYVNYEKYEKMCE